MENGRYKIINENCGIFHLVNAGHKSTSELLRENSFSFGKDGKIYTVFCENTADEILRYLRSSYPDKEFEKILVD